MRSIPTDGENLWAGESMRTRALGWLRRTAAHDTTFLLLVVIVLVVVFSILSPSGSFLSSTNFKNIALDTAEILVLAAGTTFVIISGNIDLSIGSVVVFASVVFGVVLTSITGSDGGNLGLGLLVAVPAAVGAGAAWGLVNGVLSAHLRIPSFVVTLGTLSVALGLAQIITGGMNVPDVPIELQAGFGLGSIAGVPCLVWVAAIVTGVLWFLLSQTRFGLHTYALGANPEGARRAGIPVVRHAVAVFVLMGALAGIVAVMDVSRFNTTSIGAHSEDALQAIAAAIIGGTSLFGGKGRMSGTVIGAFIPSILRNGLVLVGVQPFWQNVAVGSILIGAVYVDQRRRRRQAA